MTRTGILSDASVLRHCSELRPVPMDVTFDMLYTPTKSKYRKQVKYAQPPARPQRAIYMVDNFNSPGLSSVDEFAATYEEALIKFRNSKKNDATSETSSTNSLNLRAGLNITDDDIPDALDEQELRDVEDVIKSAQRQFGNNVGTQTGPVGLPVLPPLTPSAQINLDLLDTNESNPRVPRLPLRQSSGSQPLLLSPFDPFPPPEPRGVQGQRMSSGRRFPSRGNSSAADAQTPVELSNIGLSLISEAERNRVLGNYLATMSD